MNRPFATMTSPPASMVILGILAAIVIPQFTEASDDAEAQSARSTLQTVRSQFELCRFKGDCSDCGDYDGVDSGSSNIVGDLVDWDDSVTYTLGVGRRFSDEFSGSISVGYEAPTNEPASNLSPTDGYISVSVGGQYQINETTDISGGIRYVWLGDATTEPPVGGTFEDNTAIALGVSIGYSF